MVIRNSSDTPIIMCNTFEIAKYLRAVKCEAFKLLYCTLEQINFLSIKSKNCQRNNHAYLNCKKIVQNCLNLPCRLVWIEMHNAVLQKLCHSLLLWNGDFRQVRLLDSLYCRRPFQYHYCSIAKGPMCGPPCTIGSQGGGLTFKLSILNLSLIHIWRCRRSTLCRSRWSPYH